MRIAFFTLGCKVNQYETEIMQSRFAQAGFDIVDVEDEADVYVINSCTVTSSGDKKTKQTVRRLKRKNPNAIVALTGCFPQAFPDEAELIPEADIVQGSYNRGGLLENVRKALIDRERIVDITPHQKNEPFEPMKASRFLERTRAFIKIEDGCDRYCSYCIIPKARGPIRSKSLEEIKSEVEALANNGYREIVLVGINLSSYGKETKKVRLIDAIETTASISGIERIRLGSLEPELLTDDDLIRMSKIPKFCDQFHLSLQSGCRETLKRMNRHYDAEEYFDIVQRIRRYFNNPSITTDIMVGFAGETEDEFEQSVAFVKRVGFAKMHVFTYSIREGTRAATMPNQIDKKIKEERSRRMIETEKRLHQSFLNTQLGMMHEVLFETACDENCYVGYTKNYTRVVVRSKENLCGKIANVKLLSMEEEHCLGELE